MRYPGYCRLYDTVVRELVERGHRVSLCFGSLDYSEALSGLSDLGSRLEVRGKIARPNDDVSRLAFQLSRIADALHYLTPEMSVARSFALGRRKPPPGAFGVLASLRSLPAWAIRPALAVILGIERALPSGPDARRELEAMAPDVVVLTPLVEDVRRQGEMIRAARGLGIPSVGAIASWDNLTTSSLIPQVPDRLLVWNETQVREAVSLHRIPRERLEVTGAQPFDRWFDRAPLRTRAELLSEVGLATDRRLILYVGSVAKDYRPDAEKRFVLAWIEALRGSGDDLVSKASILIRPHPYGWAGWSPADAEAFDNVALWPQSRGNSISEPDREAYFDSLWHSDAVTGINTSAMVEAAIAGTPVFTIAAPGLEHLQTATRHFRYLLPEHGGCVMAADTLDEHVGQLSSSFAQPAAGADRARRFVKSFIRPHGLDVEATPRVVDAIERAAVSESHPRRPSTTAQTASRGLMWGWRRWRTITSARRSLGARGLDLARRRR